MRESSNFVNISDKLTPHLTMHVALSTMMDRLGLKKD